MNIRTMIILAALVLWGCGGEGDKVSLPADVEPAKPKVQTPNIGKIANGTGDINTNLTLAGTVETYRDAKVAAGVSGVVEKVLVEEGQVVKAGDVLVEIDPATYRLRVRQAEAARRRGEAQVAMLEKQFNRAKQLLDRNAATQADFDMISGQLEVARAGVAEAEVGVQMARNMLSDSKVSAPYDAVVTRVAVSEGDFAAAGPTALIELAEISRLRARIEVPESYLARVTIGQDITLRVPSIGKSLNAKVESINPLIKPGTRSFAALMELENTDLELRPGMFVEATIGGQR